MLLLCPINSRRSDTVVRGIVVVGWKATPRHRKSLVPTSVDLRRRRASPARPIRAALQSLSFEVVGHLTGRGRSRLQSSCPCYFHGPPLHDRRSSTFGTHRRHAGGRQESVLYR